MRYRLLAVALVAACGRYEFDESRRLDAGIDAATDGPPGALETATHRYRLMGSLADDQGGPALVSRGGALGNGGFLFGKNKALVLDGAAPVDVYTIDVKVAFDELNPVDSNGYVKVLDFKGLVTDEGLYFYKDLLRFVVLAAANPIEISSEPQFAASRLAQITLTRSATGKVIGYVNKLPVIQFDDTTGVATFTRAKPVAAFAIDDDATGGREASGGVLREIIVWDRALSAAEIASLP